MNKSESIKEIAAALAEFNGKVAKISKDAKNPQFRSAYVTLDALIEATRPLLQEAGLSILQFPLTKESGEIGVQTVLVHSSGEYIESEALYMTPTRMKQGGVFEIANDPQAAGSLVSYLRRYSYQAILNLNTGEDDDGNKATPNYSQTSKQATNQTSNNVNNLTEKQVKRLFAIAKTANYDENTVRQQVSKKYKTNVEDLSKEQYDYICNSYQELGGSSGQQGN